MRNADLQSRSFSCRLVGAILISVSLFVTGVSRAADCDLEAGARIYQRCIACHSLKKGEHGVGPSLHDVLGKSAGKQDGFLFSAALATADIVWTSESLSAFLENPMSLIPGSIMAFPGIKKPEERLALICWLATPRTEE